MNQNLNSGSPGTKQKCYQLHLGVQVVDVADSPIKSDESTGSPLLSYKCVWEFIQKCDNRLTLFWPCWPCITVYLS